MSSLEYISTDIDRARRQLPRAPAGTPDARDFAAIERFLLMAKGRLETIRRRPDPAGSTDAWGR